MGVCVCGRMDVQNFLTPLLPYSTTPLIEYSYLPLFIPIRGFRKCRVKFIQSRLLVFADKGSVEEFCESLFRQTLP